MLVLSAALLAPTGILLGRATDSRVGRWLGPLAVGAAAVQVVGLSRWVLLVPGVSADALDPARSEAAHARFEQLHLWLGTVVGETLGYLLTAAFTAVAAVSVVRALAPRWMVGLGLVSAGLVVTGVLVPLSVHLATVTNFAGYVGWCLWLLALAVVLWRTEDAG